MDKLEFWSSDKRFGIRLHQEQVNHLIRLCIEAGNQETGGILVGYYNETHHCATVTEVSDSPPDSTASRTWFDRGIQGLQQWLDQLWHQKIHYLGEWHFHPNASSTPSKQDLKQMQKVAASKLYACPEPLLLIIGGTLPSNWSIGLYVCFSSNSAIELKLCDMNSQEMNELSSP
jgi:integrative and conjugative element protein (TIGR02256 family)